MRRARERRESMQMRLRRQFLGTNPFNLIEYHQKSEEATLELRYAVEKFANQVTEIYSKYPTTGISDSVSIESQLQYLVWRLWAGFAKRQENL